MKCVSIILLCSISLLSFAETNNNIASIYEKVYLRDHPIRTDKLSVSGEESDIWLKFYEFILHRGKENVIPIIANFNLNNVRSIMIEDENARKNICGRKQQRALLLLNFDQPNKNIKQIQTYINKPCFDDLKARFKLLVETNDGKYYTNTSTITATKNAFGTAYDANYDEKRKPYIQKNINSNKLNLIPMVLEDSPEAWVVVSDFSYPGKITTTPISISFNIKNVQTIKIDDINAHNNKCTVNSPINLLNLTFMDSKIGQTKITTEIPTPCLYHDKAKLQLSIKTKSGEKFFKVVTLPRKAVEY